METYVAILRRIADELEAGSSMGHLRANMNELRMLLIDMEREFLKRSLSIDDLCIYLEDRIAQVSPTVPAAPRWKRALVRAAEMLDNVKESE